MRNISVKKIPLYQQIIDFYMNEIQTGALLPGSKLPPERTIAKEWQVNRSTVVRALEELASLGWISRTQGSGTHVSQTKLGNRQTPFDHWPALNTKIDKEDPYLEKLKEQKKNSHSIDLYSGDLTQEMIPDFLFPTMSWDDILREDTKITPEGYSPLITTLYAHLHQQFPFDDSQQLLITSGATQGIQLIVQSILKKGDLVATEDPSFLFALPYFSQAGIRLLGVPQDEDGMSASHFQHLCQSKKIKLLYLNPTHQNPTGKTMSLHRRKQIIALCERYQIPIVEDDIFGELNFEKAPPKLKELAPNQVVFLGSLSKIFSPLIKIGWVLAPIALIQLLSETKERLDLETEIFPQLIAHQALSDPNYKKKHKELVRHLVEKNELFNQFLSEIDDNWVSNPIHGGIFHWLTWQGPPLKRKDWDVFLNHAVLLAPSFLFSNDTMSCRINYTKVTKETIVDLTTRFKLISTYLRKDEHS